MALSLDRATVAHLERVLARDRHGLPLAESVARTIGAESWLLTLAPDGRLRAVTVLGACAAVPPTPPPAPPPAEPESPLERGFSVPAGGSLARVAGATMLTGRQLADLALRQTDAELRAEAVGVVVDAALRDPALERAILGGLEGFDDATLANALAGVAGDGAPGIASLVAERARGRPLGRRAARVLERLRPR